MTDFNFAAELEEFFKNTAYGTPDNITRDGCIALALLDNILCKQNNIENGTLWNYWRHKYHSNNTNYSNFGKYNTNKDGHINFSHFDFDGFVDFRGATFTEWASFNDATFTERADFSGVIFTKFAEFSGANFTKGANFNGATFKGANFSGAKFKKNLHLDNCIFEESPPWLFDAELCENFTVLNCDFASIPPSDTAKRAFAKTKEHYAKIKNTQGELEFAVYELEQERLLEKKWGRSIFFWLYKHTAHYGQSIWKPLFCYLLSFVLFKAIILIYDADLIHFDTAINWYTVLDVCKISFDGFMPSVTSKPLELVSIPLSRQAGSWLTVLYAIQKFFSIIGWFLIALAMKNLFKIRSGG